MTELTKPLITGLAFASCAVAFCGWCYYPYWKEREIQRKVDAIERGR